MRKLLQTAVSFCVLLLMFSGCSKTQAVDQNLENIRFSNLKTDSSALSQKEQTFMNEICSILEAAEYAPSWNYYDRISMQNISQNDLNLDINICGFDKDGCLKFSDSIPIWGWKKGQNLSYALSRIISSDIEKMTIIGSYAFNGVVYMTEPIPLPITSEQKASDATINYAGYLPTVFTLTDLWDSPASYSLLDFTVQHNPFSTYYDLFLFIRKETGKDNNGDSIDIRILDEDGHVHYTGSNTVYLSCGETARVVFSIPIYEPGEYYLELK